MTANTRIKRRRRPKAQRGFSMMQVLVTLAVVSVVSSLAILGIASAKQRIRLTNSSRLLASYVEKARVDSVRRHPMASADMAGIEVLDKTRYRVKMDFDGNGTVETREFSLDDGVIFATDPIALAFDWRGRLVDLPLTDIKVSIVMQWGKDASDQRYVDVTRSGDVTIDSDVYLDDVPNVNVNVNGMTGIDSGSQMGANNNPNPTPTPSPDVQPDPSPTPIADATPPRIDPSPTPQTDPTPEATPDQNPSPSPSASVSASPSPSPSPATCTADVSTEPSPLSFPKHGTGTITFRLNTSGSVTFVEGPNNLTVTGSGTTFTVTSVNNTRGNFTLYFSTPCGTKSVGVSVTN